MSKLPAMPFFVDAYLADTRKLSWELRGVYTDLLFFMWAEGGKLRDDDSELAARIGAPLKKWLAIRPLLIAFFIRFGSDEAGWWLTQKRLQEEWNYVQDRRAKNAEKGRRSGASRREKSEILNHGSTAVRTTVQPQFASGSNRRRTPIPIIDNNLTTYTTAEGLAERLATPLMKRMGA